MVLILKEQWLTVSSIMANILALIYMLLLKEIAEKNNIQAVTISTVNPTSNNHDQHKKLCFGVQEITTFGLLFKIRL